MSELIELNQVSHAMISIYETTECKQQEKMSPREPAKTCFDDCELENSDSLIATDQTKKMNRSSPPASLVITSDNSSFKEPAICSMESKLLPGESYDEEIREKEDNDKGTTLCTPLNIIHDSFRMEKSRNERSKIEDRSNNDKHDETAENKKVESISISTACDVTLEASTCKATRKELREQRSKDQDVAVCCENMTGFRLNVDERQDEEVEREIIAQQDDGNKLFYEAVRSGNAKRVSALISSGCIRDLDEPDWNVSGDPPLLVAATNHYLPVLSILLVSGCDPTVRSLRGETALHRVILNNASDNMLQLVEDLLKHDCPPGVKEAGSGSTALHVLSRQLSHAPLKSLHHNFDVALKTLELLANAGPVNAKDHQGRSALHILASSTMFDNNHKTDIESLIQTLLAAGVNTALRNDRGETALHESLECGALNTAMLLIPCTLMGIASRYGETPLHVASRKNHVDIVAKLLEHGEDPSTQDAGGNTPLHLASARGFHQTVSLLVTSPLAQLEKINIDGLTALQVAAESGFINAVRILLKAGADPSQTMHHWTSILRRHPDISLLIDHELTRRRQLAA